MPRKLECVIVNSCIVQFVQIEFYRSSPSPFTCRFNRL